MQRDKVAYALKSLELPKGFWQSIFKSLAREEGFLWVHAHLLLKEKLSLASEIFQLKNPRLFVFGASMHT